MQAARTLELEEAERSRTRKEAWRKVKAAAQSVLEPVRTETFVEGLLFAKMGVLRL